MAEINSYAFNDEELGGDAELLLLGGFNDAPLNALSVDGPDADAVSADPDVEILSFVAITLRQSVGRLVSNTSSRLTQIVEFRAVVGGQVAVLGQEVASHVLSDNVVVKLQQTVRVGHV